MNSAEADIVEGIGLLIGFLIRLALKLLVVAILPALGLALIGYLWLHEYVTSWLADACELPDSFVMRIVVGAFLLPIALAVIAFASLLIAVAVYLIVTGTLNVLLQGTLITMMIGAILSALAFARDRLGDAGDAPLELDFADFWND